MWTLAVTIGATEFSVAERLRLLGLEVFCPYTVEKARVKLPGRGRATYKATEIQVPLWSRYLFVKTENLILVRATRDVNYLVKDGEGSPALLAEEAMLAIMRGCDASGQVVNRSKLHSFSVGDLLRFVGRSSFAGQHARVISVEDNGALRVLVNDHLKVSVDFKDLAL